MEVNDRAAWRSGLAEEFDDGAWQPFRESLAENLDAGLLSATHAERARRLLAQGVTFQPLLPEIADATADFIATEFITGNPLNVESGITLDELKAIFRSRLRTRAAGCDPLSVTAWSGGQLVAALIFWDPVENDSASDLEANLASEGGRLTYLARQRADAMVADVLRGQTGTAGVQPHDRLLLSHIGATHKSVRIHVRPDGAAAASTDGGDGGDDDDDGGSNGVGPDQYASSLMGCIVSTAHMRVIRSGVYSLIKFYAHKRSIMKDRSGAPILQHSWQTADPDGEPMGFLVYLTVPYKDIGLPGKTDQSMFTAILRISSRPTHVWDVPAVWTPPRSLL